MNHTLDRVGRASLCLALLLCTPELAARDYYSWRDANGRLVVSDRPPDDPSIPYTKGHNQWTGRSDQPAVPAFRDDGEQGRNAIAPPASSSTPQRAAAPPAPKTIERTPDPDKCAAARDRLFKLETFPRMRMQDENGEVRFMTDAERREQTDLNRQAEARYCND